MGDIENKLGEIERLLSFLKTEGMQMSDFANKIGVSTRTVNNSIYENKPLGPKFLRGFVKVGGSLDWLLAEKGSMYLNQKAADSFAGVKENASSYSTSDSLANDPDFYGIKLYKNPVSAGHGNKGETDEFTLLYFPLTWFDSRNLIASNLVAVNVPGDSQEPDIPAGSVVLVDVTDTEVKNEQFYVFNVDDDVLIKEMHLTFDGYIAKSKNHEAGYDDIVLTKDKINSLNIIGRAVRALPDVAL